MRKKNASANFIKTCFCQAFIDLLKTKSYLTISISDICRKSGFGRTSYYRYFSNNKEELLLFISHLKWEEYKKSCSIEEQKDEGKMLLNHIYQHREFFLLLYNQNLTHVLVKILFNEFGRKTDENILFSYGKAFFTGAYFGIIYNWIIGGCKDTPEEISSQFMQGIMLAIELEKNKNK